MSNRVFWLIAVVMLLACAALTIAYAGLEDEYTRLRDGERIVGTVVRAEPHRTHVTVEIDFKQRGMPSHTWAYPKLGAEAAELVVGAHVDLLASTSDVIRPSLLDTKRPPAVLLPSAIVMFVLFVLCVVLQRTTRLPAARANEPLDVITVAVARTRNVRLAGAILFVVIAFAFAVVPLADAEASGGEIAGIEGLAALSLGLTAWLASIAYRLRDPSDNPIVELITQRPHDIAWFYVQELRGRMGVTVLTAVIKKTDGKGVDIRLTREDADVLLAELARRAPHAARGFSRETEKQYRESPIRWRPHSPP